MTKHFPGGGPQRDGEDPHFPYGKDQIYPGGMFEYHLRVFEAAFAAGTAQIMPYYGRPVGEPIEEVGFGYNHDVITGLLRERYGFDGVVCTDWALVTDMTLPDGSVWEAKAWGVEELSREERVAKILDAGCDQFGGERIPEVVVALVEEGRIASDRVNASARRLLRDKFRLGLFDEPRVDPGAAERVCGNDEFRAAGERMQRRSAISPQERRRASACRRRRRAGRSAQCSIREARPAISSRRCSTPATWTSRIRSYRSCSRSPERSRRCSFSISTGRP